MENRSKNQNIEIAKDMLKAFAEDVKAEGLMEGIEKGIQRSREFNAQERMSKAEYSAYVADENVMRPTFERQLRWGNVLGVHSVAELNARIKMGEFRELVVLSEAIHSYKIGSTADDIIKKRKRVVLVAGPSSSGKTTFSRSLMVRLKVRGHRPFYLGTDDYFLDREDCPKDENGEYDFENLDALDLELFESNLTDLLAGKEVDLPRFNFITGKKEFGTRAIRLAEDQVIVIEGIHALNPILTANIPDREKFHIYISPVMKVPFDDQTSVVVNEHRLIRRIVRDNSYRAKSAEDTILAWPKVRAGEEKNIFPYAGNADTLYNSVHLYEMNVLKNHAEPLLHEIKEDSPAYETAQELLKFLAVFEPAPEEECIAVDSILREFIGGSVYEKRVIPKWQALM